MLTWHDDLNGELAAAWDARWADLDLHPFQHRLLAEARAQAYRQDIRFAVGRKQGALVFGAVVQVRRTNPWPVRLAVTRGPWAIDEGTLQEGLTALCSVPVPGVGRPMSARVDPHRPLPAQALENGLAARGFGPVPPELHQQTILVDLMRSEAEMLASFRTLTRRQIKKAEKLGLKSRWGGEADIEAYLDLHRVAASRKGYGLPAAAWLQGLLRSSLGRLMITEADGRLVGGAWWAIGSRTAHYLYGATAADFAGPALYQAFWEVFRNMAAEGVETADLGGLPDDDGIAFFKSGFGGQEVRFTAEWERCERPLAAFSWSAARSLLRRG